MSDARLQHWLSNNSTAPLIVSSHLPAVLSEALADLITGSKEQVILEPLKGTISIKAVREMLATVSNTSWQGLRIVVIRDAECLTEQATNALLKILEDTTKQTRFVLLTKWPQRLLATIRSRCEHIRLKSAYVPGNAASTALPSVLELLGTHAKAHDLDEDFLHAVQQSLEQQLREQGPSAQLQRAYQRLRDYYLVSSRRGSTKLAKDVLIGALPSK